MLRRFKRKFWFIYLLFLLLFFPLTIMKVRKVKIVARYQIMLWINEVRELGKDLARKVWVWNWGARNQRQERIRSWQTAVSINHTSVLAKADLFHTCEYIHIQLANSNIVKTSDLFRKEDLAEVESEVGVKYWIRGTTGETGFHSILFASFYPGEEPSGTLVEISTLASRARSQQVSRRNLGGNLQKYWPIL